MDISYPTSEELESWFDEVRCEPRADEILVIDAPPIFDKIEREVKP